MSCNWYEQRETGELDEEAFQRHVSECDLCREKLRQDEQLLALAGGLKQPTPPPFLWEQIEVSLHAEKRGSGRTWIYRIAAVLVVSLGIGGAYVHFDAPTQRSTSSSLYSPSALEKVRDREREYVAAIEELAQAAGPRLDEMDLDLMLLYRDKIQTIDTQIARCLDALHNNPANTHIRRYLLLALQDKRQTLQEIVQLEL
ncbi:MAG: hypothetical protein HN712_13375 [Gemmatimonadetes bacterium]|jgi:hypothetical protein|nr:hypothetical protein [Gemmatimonadota bacterium]MBT6149100.1 hypothetical protein [Gemmatimonadota bacterium]MBT7861306.1 hypothetical protein [Gemmatimonadota bacterium]